MFVIISGDQEIFYAFLDVFPEDKISVIAQELNYFPADMEIFSVTGCKRVPEKVTYVMDEE